MKTIHFSGKRKRAVARATMKEGKGMIGQQMIIKHLQLKRISRVQLIIFCKLREN